MSPASHRGRRADRLVPARPACEPRANRREAHMRIGRWSINHPKSTLAAWLAFVATCVALGVATGTATLDNGAAGESARGYAMMDANRLWGPARELAYLHDEHGRVPPPVIADMARRMRAAGLTPQHQRSTDGRSAVVFAPVASDADVLHMRRAV